ncbi:hypothetical protein [Bradyrhizobium glycinis]|uniref:hypothetical protein n=1 Tax=Bradyrhizobium glycinis TaxID=2751812 RepID=UPI0018D77526|nr:hypothetical protein [Bradyrhizobium glycinis]MBH5372954.1 hypothetical protein [Bradyrhizobium glycinis]
MTRIARYLGYAVLFGSTVKIDGRYERFAQGAFSDADLPAAMLPIKFNDHGPNARTIGEARTFQDDVGLGFYANVRPEWSSFIRAKGFTKASIMFSDPTVKADFDLGARRETIVKAKLIHIAICGDEAIYQDSLVWRLDDHAAMLRGKNRDLVSNWAKGAAAAIKRLQARRSAAPKNKAGLEAIFEVHRPEIERIRAVARSNPAAMASAVWGHLGFSKAADKFFGKVR